MRLVSRSTVDIIIISLVIIICFGISFYAKGQNYEPNLGAWYESLTNLKGERCCSVSDCRKTDYRLTANGYEVLIDNRFPTLYGASPGWYPVADWAAVPRTPNPTGSAVACFYAGQVHCLVMPPET
jgi:hypothetical protein